MPKSGNSIRCEILTSIRTLGDTERRNIDAMVTTVEILDGLIGFENQLLKIMLHDKYCADEDELVSVVLELSDEELESHADFISRIMDVIGDNSAVSSAVFGVLPATKLKFDELMTQKSEFNKTKEKIKTEMMANKEITDEIEAKILKKYNIPSATAGQTESNCNCKEDGCDKNCDDSSDDDDGNSSPQQKNPFGVFKV